MSKRGLLVLVLAALALPPAAGAATPSGARGTGVLEPGCATDAIAADVYCPQFPIWFSLQAQSGPTAASGLFRTRWLVPGRASTIFRGRVQCLSVVGNAMVVGGVLTQPAALGGTPFVEYAVDNGASGDLVSDLGFFPFDDPDLVFLPAGFPSVCPAPGLLASIYGYLPVHSGGVVVRPATP